MLRADYVKLRRARGKQHKSKWRGGGGGGGGAGHAGGFKRVSSTTGRVCKRPTYFPWGLLGSLGDSESRIRKCTGPWGIPHTSSTGVSVGAGGEGLGRMHRL